MRLGAIRIRMTSMVLAVAMPCVMALVVSGPLAAQGSGISTEVDVAYMGCYVWRGLVANPDPVVQPSLTIAWDPGLSINLWSSVDTTDVSGAQGRLAELDYTLNYDWQQAGTDWSVGAIHYSFPNTSAPATTELYASTSLGGEMDTALSLFWDIGEVRGAYMSLSSGTTVPIGHHNLELAGSLGLGSSGYNSAYFGSAKWGLVNATFSLEIPISSGGNWSVAPTLVYSTLLDRSLREAVDQPDNLIAGVTASASF